MSVNMMAESCRIDSARRGLIGTKINGSLGVSKSLRDFGLSTCHHAPMSEPIAERLRAALGDRYELHEELGARS